jgi:sugar phosphate isomerase/epimerase
MMLSCLPVSLYPDFAAGRRTLGEWFRLASSLGLDGADLSVAHILSRSPTYLDGLRQEAAEAGVPIAMLVTYSDFTHPVADERARQVDEVRAWIEAAHRMGVIFLRLTAGQAHPGVREDMGLGWAADGLTACVDDAAAAGVRLLYENHVRGVVWQYNDFTQPAARFLNVARRTAGSGLEILFDTANCTALGDDPIAVLTQVIDRVGAVHLADIRRRGAFEPTLLGTGVAPIRELLQRMATIGFDGWISIEAAGGSSEEGFSDAVRFADRTWIEAGGRPRRELRT